MKLFLECLMILGLTITGLGISIIGIRLIYGKNLTYRLTLWLSPMVIIVAQCVYILAMLGVFNPVPAFITATLSTIAVLGSFYALSTSLIRKLQIIGDNVSESAGKMFSAATHVSQTSQTIAEGTSAQAAAIEETSSSLEEMSSMLKRNADDTDEAKSLMGKTKTIISNVTGHMNDMAQAMQEISETSAKTAKIVKTIDEIAFQTNLLALNAAVEAARAGEAGAGFAVVADEVRNLAMRAADAARNTSELIENILTVVKKGSELTPLTQSAFSENIELTEKISVIINDIAAAAREQEMGIGQITKAVTELDRTSQVNASTTQESASAAAEVSAQAMTAQDAVCDLLALIHGQRKTEELRALAVQA